MAHSDKYQDILIKPGMNEAIDSRLLPMGTPRLLQNVRTRQAARFEKRPGATSLGVSGFSPTGYAAWVGSFGGSATVATQAPANAQSANVVMVRGPTGQWNTVGRHGFVVPERRVAVALSNDDHQAFSPASVAIDGVIYVAWHETNSSLIRIVAMTPEGVKLRENTVTTGAFPRFIYTGGVLYLVYTNASTTLQVSIVTPSTLAVATAVTIGTISGSAPRPVFDCALLEGFSGRWLVAYAETANILRVRVMSGTTSVTNNDFTTVAAATFISIAGQSGNKIVVAYVDSTVAVVKTMNSDTSSPAGTVTVHTLTGNESYRGQSGVVRTGANEWCVVFGGADTTSAPAVSVYKFWHARVTGTPSLANGPYEAFRFIPCSKPFITGSADTGDCRVSIVAHDAAYQTQSLQSSHCILDLEEDPGFRLCGQIRLAGISYEHQPCTTTTPDFQVPDVASLGSGQYFCPINWEDPGGLAGVDGIVFRAARTADSVAWAGRKVQDVGGALLVSGAALYEHSGVGNNYLVENGFANDPIMNSVGLSGGALTAGQNYQYRTTYAWLDQVNNKVHRSAPSAPGALAPTPTGVHLRGQLKIATISTSGRYHGVYAPPVVAEVYRSWNGGPYYYVASVDVPGISTQAATVTYNDDATDTTVSANRTLYTDGEVIPNEPPSGARLFCSGGNRVFTVGWKANVVEFSKLIIPTAPVEFCDNDAFRIFYEQELTALAWMDDALVAFSEKAIWLVTGDGPNDQGVGVFSEPRQLPAMVGSDSPHVVEVADGLMYKGAGTIWLLPRGFGPPQPVGDAIQNTLGNYPHLRAAFRASNADDDCTHFVLASSDTPAASGYVAVYDNRFGSWSLDDIAGEVGAAGAVDGKFTWMLPSWDATADIPVRQFSTTSHQDYDANGAAAFIERRIEFGDWRPAGVVGQARLCKIGVLGEYGGTVTPPTMTAVITTDGTAETKSIAVSGATGVGFYRELEPVNKAGTAFQLSLSDTYNGGYVASHSINALGIEIDTEPGLRRPNSGERV